ncbi:MAG: nitroreductase family protein [Acidobacteriota bacterium]
MSQRQPQHDVLPLFVDRWSPRAFRPQALAEKDLAPLLEAARWAPSAFNGQPWRFLWALRERPQWEVFLDLLVPANQTWAQHAGALLVVLSRQRSEHKDRPAPTHSFDAGAAWMSLALQATASGLAAHAMAGFDAARARTALTIPEVYAIDAMVAIGWPGDRERLPEALREREVPSGRRKISELAFEGPYPADASGST